jgi:hypothetical protein
LHPPAPRPPSPWPAFSLSAYRKHRTSPFRSLRFDALFSAEERDVGFVVHARRTRVGRVESPSTLLLASLLASLSSLGDHLRRASPPLPSGVFHKDCTATSCGTHGRYQLHWRCTVAAACFDPLGSTSGCGGRFLEVSADWSLLSLVFSPVLQLRSRGRMFDVMHACCH